MRVDHQTAAPVGATAIVGVGLIGGSIGMALRAAGHRVVGIGRDPARLDEARRLGAIDEAAASADLPEVLRDVAVAVVCTPVDRIATDVVALAAAGPDDLLITDAGSTKRALVERIEADPIAVRRFVAAHPIAGSERQGVAHSRADMFEGRVCALTPTERTPPDRLERARCFWKLLGCRIVELDPVEHDRRLALTSHLPHAVSSALSSLVPPDHLPLAAGAHRDVTRVAGADAALWASIFLENRTDLLSALAAFRSRLELLEQALSAGDRDRVEAWWAPGRAHRMAFLEENSGKSVASRADAD
ncbi:MAG: prephenate dehydrogenase [Isosphaeraceae bacterium]|nr:prephenate dehydrogenase [Isosphaeraceae bacterium]